MIVGYTRRINLAVFEVIDLRPMNCAASQTVLVG